MISFADEASGIDVDRNQRYRFVNKALLDWFGKRNKLSVDRTGRGELLAEGHKGETLRLAPFDGATRARFAGYARAASQIDAAITFS